jgi:UDP-N-acetylglucosamine 3-dehydrogenase
MRVGVIGSGFAGSTHARACLGIEGVQVVAVAAATHEESPPLARECGARATASAEDLYNDASIDVIVVASPTYLHAQHAIAVAEAGKHVFCEKPLARTLEEADAIVEACHRAKVTLGVGHVVRFFPEYRQAKALIDGGVLGRPGLATFTRGTFPVGKTRAWYMDDGKSGRVLLDLMLHDLDTARWWFGEPELVHARTVGGSGGLDYALATLRYRDRPIVHLEASWAEHAGFRTTFEVRGERGMLTHDSRASAPFQVQAPAVDGLPAVMPATTTHDTPYRAQLRSFFVRLAAGLEPLVGPRDGYNSLALGLAVARAARERGAVEWKAPA